MYPATVDHDLGRFTQMDLRFGDLTDPISLNRWQYAGCNPINATDPSGLQSTADVNCFLAAVNVLYGALLGSAAAAAVAAGVLVLSEGAVPLAAVLFTEAAAVGYESFTTILGAIEDANAYCG